MRRHCKKLIASLALSLMLLNSAGLSFAETGQILPIPESSWKRIDDSDKSIIYEGNWETEDNTAPVHREIIKKQFTNGTVHFSNMVSGNLNNSINFKFTGSKLRLITNVNSAVTRKATIVIDGVKIDFSPYDGTVHWTEVGIINRVIFEKNDLNFGAHEIKIYADGTNLGDDGYNYLGLDAIDIDENGKMLDYNTPILTATSNEKDIQLNWTNNTNSVYNVKRSDTPNGPYTEIAHNISTNNFIDTTAKPGLSYYYVITAVTNNVESDNSNEVHGKIATGESGVVLNIEPDKTKIKTTEKVVANLTIDNIKEIAAEDIRVKYDATKLKYDGVTEVDGFKLVKNDEKAGELRFIVASKGNANIVSSKKTLLQLGFTGIAPGEAKVDVIKGRVSDGIEMEKDLTDEQCGEATILIEQGTMLDVNNSGAFTLLDLAIDARHLNKDPKSEELKKYNTDIVLDNAINENDLSEIGRLMLENPEYKF